MTRWYWVWKRVPGTTFTCWNDCAYTLAYDDDYIWVLDFVEVSDCCIGLAD